MANYQLAAERVARQNGIDPAIFKAMIQQESGFNPNARSPAGAQGIAQFMPATARAYGVNLNDGNAMDDLQGAARYLKANLARTGGSYAQALSIYNSGRPDGYKHIAETRNYVNKILGSAKSTGTTSGVTTQTGGGSVTVPGVSIPGIQSVTDPALVAANRAAGIAAWYLGKHDPDSIIVKSGALDPMDTQTTALTSQMTPSSTAKVGPSLLGGAVGAPSAITRQRGAVDFEGKKVAAWIAPILKYARAHGWKGQVTQGFRTFADQQRIYNSGVRPAAKPGTSNHEFTAFPGGAIDASDPQGLAKILQSSPYAKLLQYAGAKDPVHFSHPHNGSY